MKKKIILFFICFFMVFAFSYNNSKADTGYDDPAMPHYENGKVIWTTLDKKAVSYPTWETVGFTLRPDKVLEKHDGNPLWDNNYAKILLQDGWKKNIPIGNTGDTNTQFTIPEEYVSKAVEKANVTVDSLNTSGYYIYLNGIFHINYSATRHSAKIYTLKEIMYPGTVNWANPNDFKDRFDVPVKFKPKAQPVQITYMETNSNVKTTFKTIKNSDGIWTKDYKDDTNYTYTDGCGLGFSTSSYPTLTQVKTSGYSIPMKKSKIVNGVTEEYYLYRVHWSKLKDEIKSTSTGKMRKARDTMTVQTNPYENYERYKSELDTIRKRTFDVQDGGIEIVAVYKKFKEPVIPEDETTSTTISKDFTEPTIKAEIKADDFYTNIFTIESGIPTTATVYTTVSTDKQTLISYKLKKYEGVKNYKQKKLDEVASEKEGKDVYTYEYVERNFSYYTVEKLNIYTLDKAVLNNYCLPGETVTLKAKGNLTIASFDYTKYSGESDHIKEPKEDVLEVGQIKVRNDKVVINGMTLMSDEWCEKNTTKPNMQVFTSLTKESGYGNDSVFFQDNLLIDAEKKNGEYDSDGLLYYNLSAKIGSSDESTLEYEIEDINGTVIHTPTVCDVMITNVKSFNQMITPDQSCASLVLDRNFSISFPTTGTHRNIKGYGTRDYSKYIAKRQIQFPFDVYLNDTYYAKNTWITITDEITQFYLPTWVVEGSYTIHAKSISINAVTNNGLDLTEELANLEVENYVATDEIQVEVSGRIYGLNLYDISDYPTWENVFRLPNSLKLTGYNYSVGTKDQNGNSNHKNGKYTLTPVNGSHPFYKNIGAIKLGYVTRFTLQTVGSMSNNMDAIKITPRFYYVDYQGKNRVEVDMYYSETFLKKKQILVKVGSDKDKLNKKAYYLGDNYLSVPEEELETTAKVTGRDIKDVKYTKQNIWTYNNIILSTTMRTFVGDTFNGNRGVKDGVDFNTVAKSVQNWYCEYYLPSDVHIVKKGFDLERYMRDYGYVDFNESFWLENGYIIINFDIETIQNSERHLSYINAENALNGYCNMWNKEGYAYTKIDYKGNVFHFLDGDYVMYWTNKSAAKDYKSSGTH